MTPQLPPWFGPLSKAIEANQSAPHWRFAQLATVRPDGSPANRSLVFRRFHESSAWPLFIVDARSEKADQIALHPDGELCWYFTQSREQFRLTGMIQLVGEDAAHPLAAERLALWKALGDTPRQHFFWPDPRTPKAPTGAFAFTPRDPETPPPNFLLLALEPRWVDHLEIAPEPHNRTIYTLLPPEAARPPGTTWHIQHVNP